MVAMIMMREATAPPKATADHTAAAGGRFFCLFVVVKQERGRVEGSVEPEEGDVNDPNTVEVGCHVEPRTRFLVGFEEDFLPFDLAEFEESLPRGDVDESRLVLHDDSLDTLGVPEQLIDIVVSNDFVVVSFPSNIFAIVNLVSLIPTVLV